MKPYYNDGHVQIFHGDCRDVLSLVRGVDALVTDPPYGIAGSSGTINRARGKSEYGRPDTLAEVRSVYVPAVVAALALANGRGAVTPGTPHCFEYPKPDDIAVILQPASVGMSKWGRATWQPVLLYGRDPRVGLTIQPLTFTSNGRFEPSAHPCPKPDDVMRWLVSRVTDEGETILDPFMGSGTTLVAAKRLGRKAVGIELDERYCEIAARRLAQDVFSWQEPESNTGGEVQEALL